MNHLFSSIACRGQVGNCFAPDCNFCCSRLDRKSLGWQDRFFVGKTLFISQQHTFKATCSSNSSCFSPDSKLSNHNFQSTSHVHMLLIESDETSGFLMVLFCFCFSSWLCAPCWRLASKLLKEWNISPKTSSCIEIWPQGTACEFGKGTKSWSVLNHSRDPCLFCSTFCLPMFHSKIAKLWFFFIEHTVISRASAPPRVCDVHNLFGDILCSGSTSRWSWRWQTSGWVATSTRVNIIRVKTTTPSCPSSGWLLRVLHERTTQPRLTS